MHTFDIEAFEQKLKKQVKESKISKETKRAYISCLETLNRQSCETLGEAVGNICKSNQHGRLCIAAVKKYERDVLDDPKALLYGKTLLELYKKYTVPALGKELKFAETTYIKKINALKNKRLKLALRLQCKSGLRVSEIAALGKNDIICNPESKDITLIVRSGKGRKQRTVDVIRDEYLFNHLQTHLEAFADDEKLFYAASYLRKKAGELNLPTHDLRRLNSRERFRKQRGSGESKRAARKEVGHQLGHEQVKITNAYLGDEWEKEGR